MSDRRERDTHDALRRLTLTLLAAVTVEDLLSSAPAAIAAAVDPQRTCRIELFDAPEVAQPQREDADRDALCVPLRSHGQLLGALMLSAPRRPTLDGPELDDVLLAWVGESVSTAVAGRLEAAARQSYLLKEAAELKFDVVSMLSHEMRTPLSSIKGYATALLLEDAEWDPVTTTEFLQTIDEETDRLARLVEDILETAAIDAGELRLSLEPVLVPRITKGVVDRIAIRGHEHRFALMFPSDWPVIEADGQRIEQVLTNLIDNAVKYSPDGGLIVVRGEVRPDEVLISVVDQGIGIAPQDLNKLFERFFRASHRHHQVVGTGLGLPISDSIVRAHGGRIWAESKVGSGTTLSFTLPRTRPGAARYTAAT
jgi:signal transduction histidine kinase